MEKRLDGCVLTIGIAHEDFTEEARVDEDLTAMSVCARYGDVTMMVECDAQTYDEVFVVMRAGQRIVLPRDAVENMLDAYDQGSKPFFKRR